jgi:hydroxyethylthiazole kinase-like uncharacterized protein yjeF
MKLLNSQESRELERKAVETGTSYLQLMENAGTSAVRFLQKRYSLAQKHVVILCGKGNNGGDGFVAARHLSRLGALVVVVLVQGYPKTDISREMFERLKNTTVKTVNSEENPEIISSMLLSADMIIDAVYGTGFHGSAPEDLHPLFSAANQSPANVIAFDIPSGANCDTGAVEGDCIKADYTVTFSTLKNGHMLLPARKYCGQVVVVPIGMDAKLIQQQHASLEVTELNDVKAIFKPRDPESNKGDYGRLLCVCGSEGMAGAAIMSAKSAIRSGAGLVDVALPRSIYSVVASQAIEPVYTLLDHTPDGGLTADSQQALNDSLSKSSACLIGCGLGRSDMAAEMVTQILLQAKVPVVLDADGINIIAENINILDAAQAPVILTPHPGEMARLCGTTVKEIQAHRLEYAINFAQKHRVVLVLKGAGTIIAEPDGRAHLNLTGNAGMAKGGSGDVLAGMIASFVAQKIEPAKAAYGAVYLHGAAGDRCAKAFSKCAMLPTDLIDMLPKLFLEIE